MQIVCVQQELAKVVSIVQRAVAARSTVAVLGNILLEANDGELRLAATNFEFGVNCWLRAEVVEAGAITVPARLLSDILGKLPVGRVTLTASPLTVALTVACGNFQATLAGLPAADFPQVHSEALRPTVELQVVAVREMIEQVAFVASRDESRWNLTCVQMQLGARLTLAATDGFRLGVRSCPLATPTAACELLVRATCMAELARLLADADPDQPLMLDATNARQVVFGMAGKGSFVRAEFVAQLVEAKYPDYQAIIPKSTTTTAGVNGAELLRSLQAARLFAQEDAQAVTICVGPDDCLQVAAAGSLLGKSEDRLDAEVKGPPVATMFNVGFLIDLLSRLHGEQVVLELTNATRPVTVRPFHASPDEFVHVIMPIHRAK